MGTSTADASARGASKSPKKNRQSPPRPDVALDVKTDLPSKTESSIVEIAKPLAPPPRPAQQPPSNTPDYFSGPGGGSLSLEPNPIEQSFGVTGQPETPGGTKLPPVAALASPASLLPGSNATPFNWGGGSLRTGPLSPAMLSGPTNDYFGDTHHLRGGFPTPNESGLRSGLTPGGSGSMFPAPSPGSQAFIAQLASGGATPSTLDFHRTALSAAAKRDHPNGVNGVQVQQHSTALIQPPATSQPVEMSNGTTIKTESKPQSGPFDLHDNDAANGLFMLAQGRNGTQNSNQYGPVQNHAAIASAEQGRLANMSAPPDAGRGDSVTSMVSDESEQAHSITKSKKGTKVGATAGRRRAEDAPAKAPPSKKAKSNGNSITNGHIDSFSDDDDMGDEGPRDKSKMTDEEKRKNFLERNRVAALKCRQRKKQWLANLQSKVEIFSNENDALTAQITQLREEVVNLKTLLLAHKDCPVTQQQGMHGAFMQQVVEPYQAPQMNPYGMGAPLPNQQVMAGQRRFS